MKKSCCILLITFAVAFSGCSRNPVTNEKELHFISESTEINMGQESYVRMQQGQGGKYTTEKEISEYVQEVGKKVAAHSDRPDLPFEFTILNNSIPNAWALPGGKIAINRGLLVELNNEAELAAVFAHEIVHSAARHSAKALERSVLLSTGLVGIQQILRGHKYEDVATGGAALASYMGVLKFSREAELEADHYGIKYLHKAGYNIDAAIELQKTFLRLSQGQRSNWFSTLFATHPPSEERIKANEKTASQYSKEGTYEADTYQEKLAPLKNAQSAYSQLDQGYMALTIQEYSKALEHAQLGLKTAPHEAHLYNLKGKAEVGLKLTTQALESFSKAIELNADYFDFYLQRGLVRKSLNLDEATEDLKKSSSLLPSEEAELALGQIYMEQGNHSLAVKHLKTASL